MSDLAELKLESAAPGTLALNASEVAGQVAPDMLSSRPPTTVTVGLANVIEPDAAVPVTSSCDEAIVTLLAQGLARTSCGGTVKSKTAQSVAATAAPYSMVAPAAT